MEEEELDWPKPTVVVEAPSMAAGLGREEEEEPEPLGVSSELISSWRAVMVSEISSQSSFLSSSSVRGALPGPGTAAGAAAELEVESAEATEGEGAALLLDSIATIAAVVVGGGDFMRTSLALW
jgi:hypothetical protein